MCSKQVLFNENNQDRRKFWTELPTSEEAEDLYEVSQA